uniref:Uncharacterized protein n=1 Tax=Mycena chlorophos TaxID=658473 RepID=A0ABQ0L0E1_MYCCL|nr:predicted protein [Mycena chlorophos]
MRLLFPRFVTYGADYPEKVLLATIKSNGGCPCPFCYCPKDKIEQLGTKADSKRHSKPRQDTRSWQSAVRRAREFIFELTRKITGPTVQRILKPFSWVPTRNAFHKIQAEADSTFNLFEMFTPDVLHEVELGLIKTTFAHLLRLLDATSKQLDALDQRYRRVPAFGRMTIRRFKRNVSEMKQFAARDFEDVMQCILPVMDGLFVDGRHDKYDAIAQDVCFDILTFHAYAKLRLHSTSSIQLLRNSLVSLGKSLRRLEKETRHIVTLELPPEYQSRMRSKSKRAAANATGEPSHRALPDGIVRVGTTDSVSTQLCEVSHRQPKIWYRTRTNRRDVEQQIAANEHRIRVAQQTEERMLAAEAGTRAPATDGRETLPEPEDDPLPDVPPRLHHQIGESTRSPWHLGHLPHLPGVPSNEDPVLKVRFRVFCSASGAYIEKGPRTEAQGSSWPSPTQSRPPTD